MPSVAKRRTAPHTDNPATIQKVRERARTISPIASRHVERLPLSKASAASIWLGERRFDRRGDLAHEDELQLAALALGDLLHVSLVSLRHQDPFDPGSLRGQRLLL